MLDIDGAPRPGENASRRRLEFNAEVAQRGPLQDRRAESTQRSATAERSEYARKNPGIDGTWADRVPGCATRGIVEKGRYKNQVALLLDGETTAGFCRIPPEASYWRDLGLRSSRGQSRKQ